jgi:hypothetical protein
VNAKELWDELKRLRRRRKDFDDLEVYVEIIDRPSYEAEKASELTEGDITLEDTVIGEGLVYNLIVPTAFYRDATTGQIVDGETFIKLCAVELEEEHELSPSMH